MTLLAALEPAAFAALSAPCSLAAAVGAAGAMLAATALGSLAAEHPKNSKHAQTK